MEAATATKRAPRPRIPDDIREQIRAAYGTMSADKAAEKFGVGRSSVERFWKGHVDRNQKAYISGLDRDGIVRMHRQGRSSTEIALMYNCSQNTVNFILRENGIVQRRNLTVKQAKNIERYYSDGDTLEKIAEKVGVSMGTVSSYISSHGLSNRNASRQNKELLMAPLRLDGTPDLRKVEPIADKIEEAASMKSYPATASTADYIPPKPPHSEFKISKLITIEGSCYSYELSGESVRLIPDGRDESNVFSREYFIQIAREFASVADMMEAGEV